MKVKEIRGETDDDGDNGVDRISELPDPLLCHILSFLPTKYAVASSILSTRWKHLFLSVPYIDLHYRRGDDQALLNFITSCHRMIWRRQGTAIRKFKLSLSEIHNERCHTALASFISAALLCQIQELNLYLLTASPYPPILLFTPAIFTSCETLVILKLECNLPTLGIHDVSLPNLKVLCLSFRNPLDTFSIQRLIKGCPLLEELEIRNFRCDQNHGNKGFDVLDSSSHSLRKLMLDFSWVDKIATVIVASNRLQSLDLRFGGNMIGKVIINVPNLKHLAIHEFDFGRLNFVGKLNSLVAAVLENGIYDRIRSSKTKSVVELRHLVQNVQSFCTTVHFLEALHGFPHWLPSFKNLQRLKLYAKRMGSTLAWDALPFLLTNAPNLEVLSLEYNRWSSPMDEEEVKSRSYFPPGLIANLKEIEMKLYSNLEDQLELIEHLLQNATSLRKFTIGDPTGSGVTGSPVCRRILSFKRRSEECRILFDDRTR